MSQAPAGLYLHVPFCSRVCPYCDFAVRTGDAARRRRYVDHLLLEIEQQAGDDWRFDTIYFGGGTPSLLEPGDLERILTAIRTHFDVAADTRLFLEANPEDVHPGRLQEWRDLGVATLSLGIQTFDDDALAFLGRRHDGRAGRRAIEQAAAVGFDTLSIDLIYGLPGQELAHWRRQLALGAAAPVQHISCYQLTVYDRTRFSLLRDRGKLTELPDEEQGRFFRVTHDELAAQGLAGYEVSQFAREPRHRSRHNMKYWAHTPYLGLGPSAHSYRDDARWWNLRRTDPWQERVAAGESAIEERETLAAEDLVLEALMTGLRTYAGVDTAAVRSRWGIDLLASNGPLLETLTSQGQIEVEGDRIVPTLEGLAVADGLARHFDLGAASA